MTPTPNNSRHRLLIVDDNPEIHGDFRKLLCFNIGHGLDLSDDETFLFDKPATPRIVLPDFDIESAYQGQEALEMTMSAFNNNHPYVLAFVDVRMPPGWDGVETVAKIWEVDPDLQVVICTAYSDYAWDDILQRLGRTDRLAILKKPFDAIEVQQLALALTEKSRLARVARQSLQVIKGQLTQQAQLLDLASDAIIVRDLEDRVLYWNNSARDILGWTNQEVLGKPLDDFLRSDVLADHEAKKTVLRNGSWKGEAYIRSKTGKQVLLEERWTLVRDSAGTGQLILSISTDITERKKMEAQFLRAQRLESIGTLTSGIAHDLNNVLAPLLMSVGLLKERINDPETTKLVDMLEASAKRGANLIKQMLAFGRGIKGERIPVSLARVAREIAQVVNETFPKSIKFELLINDGIWNVIGDPTQFHQVLLNLCVNARDAMPNGGKLCIAIENALLDESCTETNPEARPGQFVLVEVSDTGSGMSKEVQDRMFEPFFTTKTMEKGTGLGLSTSLGIVKSHDGFIFCQSEVGAGSTFSVHLPADPKTPRTECGTTANAGLPRGNNELLLIVDDELVLREVAKSTLEHFDYRVLLAGSGAEAVAIYASNHTQIAAVIVDMAMPVMDGAATIASLKAIDPSVKIIRSSGFNPAAAYGELVGHEAVDFIAKPYVAEAMLRKLDEVLRRTAQPAEKDCFRENS